MKCEFVCPKRILLFLHLFCVVVAIFRRHSYHCNPLDVHFTKYMDIRLECLSFVLLCTNLGCSKSVCPSLWTEISLWNIQVVNIFCCCYYYIVRIVYWVASRIVFVIYQILWWNFSPLLWFIIKLVYWWKMLSMLLSEFQYKISNDFPSFDILLGSHGFTTSFSIIRRLFTAFEFMWKMLQMRD